MTGIADKVKDVVGLGSHDGQASSGLTGHTPSSIDGKTAAAQNVQQSTLNPSTAAASNPDAPRRKLSDAAQMPPSAFREQVGEPTIEHDYPEDSTTKRHSVSHQENHYLR